MPMSIQLLNAHTQNNLPSDNMIGFTDLKFMYTHPRVRVVQGKAKVSIKPDWNNVKANIRHDYKNPNTPTSTEIEYISVYKNDLENLMNEYPDSMVKIHLPKAIALIVQDIITSSTDDNTRVWVRNDFDYTITTLVKEKRTFNEYFVNSKYDTGDGKPRPTRYNMLRDMMSSTYNINNLDDYSFYMVLNTAGVDKNSDPVDLNETQRSIIKQLCFYKRVNYVEIPINTNRAKLLSFINVGEHLWGK